MFCISKVFLKLTQFLWLAYSVKNTITHIHRTFVTRKRKPMKNNPQPEFYFIEQ